MKIEEEIKLSYPITKIPRPLQIEGFNFIKKSINNGKRYILCNFPCGIGKSYLGISLFINYYLNKINPNAKFDIITNSKILQDQYINEYPYICDLRGKANYECSPFDTNCEEGKEMCRIMKRVCSDCPHDEAKKAFKNGKISMMNFHLFNTFSLYFDKMIEERESSVLIVDEAHNFESNLTELISSKLSANTIKRCGGTLTNAVSIDKLINKVKKIEDYINLLNMEVVPLLSKVKDSLEDKLANEKRQGKLKEYTNKINKINTDIPKYQRFIEDYKKDPNNWVLEINKKKDDNFTGIELIVQPVWVDKYIAELCWKRYSHIIFMSGTLLSKDMFCKLNGLDPKLTSYCELESPFPIENRPIYYIPKIGKMTYNEKVNTFKNQIPMIERILNKYPKFKGLLHSNSFEFSNWIKDNIHNKRLLFHDSENREEMLNRHILSTEPTVLVSPSMTTGISLDFDLCKFIIIQKIPYPNISSPRIKARMSSNREYFNYQTSIEIIQSLGRGVRHIDDSCDHFIIDSSFSDILRTGKKYFPKYIIDAIKILK